jgi:phosphoribosyl-AMP cyclohydrolase
MSKQDLENSTKLNLNFNKLHHVNKCGDIIPVIVQDHLSKKVLILAYTNQAAFQATLKTGIATFWSTSRNCLWIKGKTSGHYLHIIDILVNCEQNSLLYLVKPSPEGVCHAQNQHGTHYNTCFYRRLKNNQLEFLDET